MPDESTVKDTATWTRLLDQIAWYDSKSKSAQWRFKLSQWLVLALAAGVPVLAAVDVKRGWIALCGAAAVVAQGAQQVSQWNTNWILYRSTAESLKHEKYLFLAKAGPYEGEDALRTLAERIEELVSQEHAKWASARTHTRTTGAGGRDKS